MFFRVFFLKILTLCLNSIQEWFLIKKYIGALVNDMEILYFLDQEQSRRAPEQTKVQRRSTTCRYKSHTCVLTGYPFAEHRFVIFETLFFQIPFPFMCNHVKQGVFSKGTVLCGGCWLWAWQISGGIVDLHCRKVESTKWYCTANTYSGMTARGMTAD